jgi:hypothetical protein
MKFQFFLVLAMLTLQQTAYAGEFCYTSYAKKNQTYLRREWSDSRSRSFQPFSDIANVSDLWITDSSSLDAKRDISLISVDFVLSGSLRIDSKSSSCDFDYNDDSVTCGDAKLMSWDSNRGQVERGVITIHNDGRESTKVSEPFQPPLQFKKAIIKGKRYYLINGGYPIGQYYRYGSGKDVQPNGYGESEIRSRIELKCVNELLPNANTSSWKTKAYNNWKTSYPFACVSQSKCTPSGPITQLQLPLLFVPVEMYHKLRSWSRGVFKSSSSGILLDDDSNAFRSNVGMFLDSPGVIRGNLFLNVVGKVKNASLDF